MFKIKHPFCDKYLAFKYDSRYYASSRRVWYFNDERTWGSLEAKDMNEAVEFGSDAVSETKKLIWNTSTPSAAGTRSATASPA